MSNKKKKDKISNYNAGTVIADIVMLLLGLVFFIGTLMGKGDDIAAGFVRIVGGILILVGVFELINFLRIKEKTVFDVIVLAIGSAIAVIGIVFIVNPLPVITVFNFIFGIIVAVYAIVIIVTSVGTLRPSGAKYWWFSLLFGIIALGMGIFIIFFNGATKALTIIIGITLVLGSVGGMANAILASQAKKEFKANSKILEDATFTVDSTTTVDESDGKGEDNVKY
ncbi:Uncharacterized membrane protein HdeD, DUF308 family [Ruminococcaceae bacterium YAD3003]|nr:Uncharacterized membrane protein HdeD, DUF308 family [Ruminococcaceae bacterium YAD3003]